MKRAVWLGLVALLVFAAVAALMLQFMPEPMKNSDYLVVGSVATLAALVALFFMMGASKGLLMKRKKKR